MLTSDGFEKKLYSITTLISSKVKKDGEVYGFQGSGFYYNEITPADPSKTGTQWYRLDKYWLITNRHVVLPKIEEQEYLPDEFTFYLRENVNGFINWFPISLTKDELVSVLKLHKESHVDVVAIDITSYISSIIQEVAANPDKKDIYIPTSLSNINLPENQPIPIDVTSDIIVASYPKSFYDTLNKFPIVKSGIIASAWGLNFKGLPIFQIDAQLFPGSSGGLVLSKPTNIAMINGKLNYNTTKQFVLLGVYSGEYLWEDEIEIGGKKVKIKKSYGLGNVWYSYLIPEIINQGIQFTP